MSKCKVTGKFVITIQNRKSHQVTADSVQLIMTNPELDFIEKAIPKGVNIEFRGQGEVMVGLPKQTWCLAASSLQS